MAAGLAWRFRFSLLSFASPAFAGFAYMELQGNYTTYVIWMQAAT